MCSGDSNKLRETQRKRERQDLLEMECQIHNDILLIKKYASYVLKIMLMVSGHAERITGYLTPHVSILIFIFVQNDTPLFRSGI